MHDIVSVLPHLQWRYVPLKENSADFISRGLMPKEIPHCRLWWEGPQWLLVSSIHWPAIAPTTSAADLPERKNTVNVNQVTESPITPWKLYSNYHKLIRTYTWVLRFTTNLKKPIQSRTFYPTLWDDEVLVCTMRMMRKTQRISFPEVHLLFFGGKRVSSPKSLVSLRLFLDKDQIIRIGGRLEASNLPYRTKYPILLHYKSGLVKLLAEQRHRNANHPGSSTLMMLLSEDYYIIGSRRLAKAISFRCIFCQRSCSRTASQLIGDLPANRLDNSSPDPFIIVGVDFAGPFHIRKGHT